MGFVLRLKHFFSSSIGSNAFHALSQTMISRYVTKYSALITQNLSRAYIRFPQNEFDRNVTKTKFYQEYQIPGILGVIDGTHVAMAAAQMRVENMYINRKGFHSINTQVVCDADMKFINVNARFPGSTHDAYIFGGSELNNHLEILYEQNPNSMNFLLGKDLYASKLCNLIRFV